jgi:hypothetical protein
MLDVLKQWFTSKKWLGVLGGVLALVAAAMTGEIEWATVLEDGVKLLIAVILGQSAIDVTKTIKG